MTETEKLVASIIHCLNDIEAWNHCSSRQPKGNMAFLKQLYAIIALLQQMKDHFEYGVGPIEKGSAFHSRINKCLAQLTDLE